MLRSSLGQLLRDWRKATGVKQETLAQMLGVSQAAVSYWENGRDIPHRRLVGRILDIMSGTADERLHVDRIALQSQTSVRASFDLDGVRLVMASAGLAQAWPEFSQLTNVRLIERLVDEASEFLHDDDFVRSVRRGEVAIVSAVSDQHVKLDVDSRFLHRWVAVFRSYGPKMLVDMTYEPCAPTIRKGVETVTHYDSVLAA